jgi:hypothetical protein
VAAAVVALVDTSQMQVFTFQQLLIQSPLAVAGPDKRQTQTWTDTAY